MAQVKEGILYTSAYVYALLKDMAQVSSSSIHGKAKVVTLTVIQVMLYAFWLQFLSASHFAMLL